MKPIIAILSVIITSAGVALLFGAVPRGAADKSTPTAQALRAPDGVATATTGAPPATTAAVPSAQCVPPRCPPPEKNILRVPNRLITVSQTTFRLRLFKRANVSRGYTLLKSYKVAVGSP